MTITWFVIAFAILALGVLGFSVWRQWRPRRSSKISARSMDEQSVLIVDLDAFSMVMDREDEMFLREKLPDDKFRRLKRQRISVAWKYVARISANIPPVLQTVRGQIESGHPETVQKAIQTEALAHEVRIKCLAMYAKLAAEYARPSLQLTPVALVPRYRNLRESLNQLGKLQAQQPALSGLEI